jgi:hypothetical protein
MRKRRVGRCLLRADLALDDGCIQEARIALEEARQLHPDCLEIPELERRLEEFEGSQQPSTPEDTSSTEFVLPSSEGFSSAVFENTPRSVEEHTSKRWLVAVGAAALVLLAGAAVGSVYWSGSGTLEEARLAEAVAPAAVPTVGIDRPSQPTATRLRIEQETVTARTMIPELVSEEPTLPPFPAPPIAAPEAPAQADPVVLAVNRETPSAPSMPQSRSDVRLDALPSAPPPEPPSRPAPAAPAVAVTAPGASPSEPSLIVRPEATSVDESVGVRGVLARYERAYSSLDARAASAVWPGVDRGALARAFDGLASQRVSLQSCDVTVTGVAARASCSGTATWVPKVGGGARQAARRWDFELRKRGDEWEIERAVAR